MIKDLRSKLARGAGEEDAWWPDVVGEGALADRSLVRHARRWQLAPEDVVAALPILPFPLALSPDEETDRVARLLTGSDEERPYTTVVRLPVPAGKEALLGALVAQLDVARRCFLGTRIRCLKG